MAVSAAELIRDKAWGALGSMAHPERGVVFSPTSYVDGKNGVRFGMGDFESMAASGLHDDPVRVWGHHGGSGEPMEHTFAEYYDRYIFDKEYTTAPQVGVNRIMKESNDGNNLDDFCDGGGYVDFHMPHEGPNADFEWSSLRLGFSWFDGGDSHERGLYLTAIVHGGWTM
jgi:hypothetical protein